MVGLQRIVPFAVVAALAGCGADSGEDLISSGSAAELLASIDRVEGLAEAGRCDDAVAAATRLQSEVSELSRTVDANLRTALANGAQRLRQLAEDPASCVSDSGTTATETTPTETTQTETAPPPPRTETAPEETQPPEETEPPPPEGTPGGGVEPPGPPGGEDGSGGAAPGDDDD